MPEIQNPKGEYDLEVRTFSRRVGTKIGYCNLRLICNLVLGI